MTEAGDAPLHIGTTVLGAAIEEAIDHLEGTGHQKPGVVTALGAWPTGFGDLDALTGGLHPSMVTLVFGKPGVGTSTFALNCGSSVAKAGGRVLYLSGQSPRREIVNRLLAAEARVPLQNLRKGMMREEHWTLLARSMDRASQLNFHIVDRPYRDLATVLASDLFIDQHWDLVVIDGVQLFTRATAPESLWAAHTRVAGDIKRAAAEHHSAFLVTVSTNRRPSMRVEPGQSGGLILPDIASSNAYAAEADLVVGVQREDLDDPTSPRAGEADLTVIKNRYGPRDNIVVAYQGHYARFVDFVGPMAGSGAQPT